MLFYVSLHYLSFEAKSSKNSECMKEELDPRNTHFDRFTIMAAILDAILKITVRAVKFQRPTPHTLLSTL